MDTQELKKKLHDLKTEIATGKIKIQHVDTINEVERYIKQQEEREEEIQAVLSGGFAPAQELSCIPEGVNIAIDHAIIHIYQEGCNKIPPSSEENP